MMTIFFYFSFIFFLKVNFNMWLNLSSEELFLASLVPLFLWLVNTFFFGLKLLDFILFFVICVFTFFCFILSDPIFFLFSFETCAILLSFLIFNLSKDQDKISSFLFMIFINTFGSILFMIFSFFYHSFFLFQLNSLNNFFIFFCFILLLCTKIPVFFFHFWLTKAHVSASGSCSMILASLMLKIGGVGIFKYANLFMILPQLKNFFWSFSILSIILMSMVMIRLFDLKYVVACSSIFHMALIFPSIYSFNYVGVISSFLMMVGHGLISLVLFFLITMLYEFSFNRSIMFGKTLESLSKTFTFFFFFFFLLNLGFPPLINFISEVLFCFLIFNFSFSSLFFFLPCLMLSVIFLGFLYCKFLEGKKTFWFTFSENVNFSFICFFLALISFIMGLEFLM